MDAFEAISIRNAAAKYGLQLVAVTFNNAPALALVNGAGAVMVTGSADTLRVYLMGIVFGVTHADARRN